MLLEIKKSCYYTAMLVDGIELIELSENKQKEILEVLLKKFSNRRLFEIFLNNLGETKFGDNICYQCGHRYEYTKLETNNLEEDEGI